MLISSMRAPQASNAEVSSRKSERVVPDRGALISAGAATRNSGKSADHFGQTLYQLNGFFSGKHTVCVWTGCPPGGMSNCLKHEEGLFGISNPRGIILKQICQRQSHCQGRFAQPEEQDPIHFIQIIFLTDQLGEYVPGVGKNDGLPLAAQQHEWLRQVCA